MKLTYLSLLSVVLLSGATQAETIKCNFTEPHFSAIYDTEKQSIVINEYDMEGEAVETGHIPGVKFLILGAGSFQVLNRANDIVLALELNNKGNDGRSDILYPYSATFALPGAGKQDEHLKGPHMGGCRSSLLDAHDPVVIEEEFPNP